MEESRRMGDCRCGVGTGIGRSDEIWVSECAVRIGAGWMIYKVDNRASNLSPLLSDRIVGTSFKLPVPCKQRLKL